jgi:hypothetical protein
MKVIQKFNQFFISNFQTVIFFISFAVGPLSIVLSPELITKGYVQSYNLANFLFSLFWTILFLTENKTRNLLFYINIILLIIIALNMFLGLKLIVWIYVFSVLMIDLSSSQINNPKIAILNRIISIFILILLAMNLIDFILFLWFRIFTSILFNWIIFFSNSELKSLKIDHPIKFILISFIFYSGSTILLSFLLNELPIKSYKILIIIFQLGLVLLLKEIDYKTRHNSSGGGMLFKFTNYTSLIIIIVPVYLFLINLDWRIFVAISIYFISYFILNYSRRYLKNV